MDHPAHFTHEQKFLRIVFVQSANRAKLGETQTLWIITGEAALLGLVISHIESVSKIISSFSLKWGMVLFVMSMLFGIIAKTLASGVKEMVDIAQDIYREFNTEQGQAISSNLSLSIPDVAEKISEPYLWPLRGYIKKTIIEGAKDPLSSEKRMVKWFCYYFYFSIAQWVFGIWALLSFAFGMQ